MTPAKSVRLAAEPGSLGGLDAGLAFLRRFQAAGLELEFTCRTRLGTNYGTAELRVVCPPQTTAPALDDHGQKVHCIQVQSSDPRRFTIWALVPELMELIQSRRILAFCAWDEVGDRIRYVPAKELLC